MSHQKWRKNRPREKLIELNQLQKCFSVTVFGDKITLLEFVQLLEIYSVLSTSSTGPFPGKFAGGANLRATFGIFRTCPKCSG